MRLDQTRQNEIRLDQTRENEIRLDQIDEMRGDYFRLDRCDAMS